VTGLLGVARTVVW